MVCGGEAAAGVRVGRYGDHVSHSEQDVVVHITSDAGHDTGRDRDAAHESVLQHRTCTVGDGVVWQVTLTDSDAGPGAELRIPDELLRTRNSRVLRQLAVAALVAARGIDLPTVEAPTMTAADVAVLLTAWGDDDDFLDSLSGLVAAHRLIGDQLQYTASLLRDSLAGDEDALLITRLNDIEDTPERRVAHIESTLGLSSGTLDEHLGDWLAAGSAGS